MTFAKAQYKRQKMADKTADEFLGKINQMKVLRAKTLEEMCAIEKKYRKEIEKLRKEFSKKMKEIA